MTQTKGAILLAMKGEMGDSWHAFLNKASKDRPVVRAPVEHGDPSIDYAVAWAPEPGLLASLPNLKAIFSVGAGVDHLFRDPDLPDVPIVRVVAEDLTNRMSEYVVWRVLDHHRQGDRYRRQQTQRLWDEDLDQPVAADVTVGILGLGALGQDAARKLRALGFHVAGWSRSPKTMEGLQSFAGDDGLDNFLKISDIIVCLLPLTDETRHILSLPLFEKLKKGGPFGAPVLINAGRGGQQIEEDIVAALDRGLLSAASLDVFNGEPLSPDSPLWLDERIFITPHAAATSVASAIVPGMLEQMDRHDAGEPLKNLVDRSRNY